MSFTSDIAAALGGAVGDAMIGQPAPGVTTPGTAYDPIMKRGLAWVMNSAGAPPVSDKGTGVRPGVYSVATPPPGSGPAARQADAPRTSPLVLIGGAALVAAAAWYVLKKA